MLILPVLSICLHEWHLTRVRALATFPHRVKHAITNIMALLWLCQVPTVEGAQRT